MDNSGGHVPGHVKELQNIKSIQLLTDFHSKLDSKFRRKYPINSNLAPIRVPIGYKVMLGFEIEVITLASFLKIKRFVTKHISPKVLIGNTKNPRYWHIHRDGSVDFDHRKLPPTANTLEISTAAMDWPDAWANLIKIVEFLHENTAITNKTCGLHINVSVWKKNKTRGFTNVTDKYKFNDFSAFVNEHEAALLTLWNRKSNPYCAPINRILKRPVYSKYRNATVRGTLDKNTVREYRNSIQNKYQSFNVRHLKAKSPYIECRVPGNASCHLRLFDAYYTIGLLAQSILDSTHGK